MLSGLIFELLITSDVVLCERTAIQEVEAEQIDRSSRRLASPPFPQRMQIILQRYDIKPFVDGGSYFLEDIRLSLCLGMFFFNWTLNRRKIFKLGKWTLFLCNEESLQTNDSLFPFYSTRPFSAIFIFDGDFFAFDKNFLIFVAVRHGFG